MGKKQIIVLVAVAVIFAGGGFFGGFKFAQAKRPTAQAAFRGGAGGALGANRRGAGAGAGGGFAGGQIISLDSKTVTVKTQNGGSMIIYLSGTTQIGKSVAGAVTDLAAGQQIVATGTGNSDGSITAQNIQIRPTNSTTPPGAGQ